MGTLRPQHFRRIFDLHPDQRPMAYIETGLWFGKQLQIAVRYFPTVVGIELNDHWWAHCCEQTRHMPGVQILHGDTRDLLPVMLDRLTDEPVFVKLDAHYCKTDPPVPMSDLPLWDELAALAERDQPDIVVVDDVHAFGRRGGARKDPGYAGWERVLPKNLLAALPGHDTAILGDGFVIWR